jgi:hypothetical protein
MQDSAFCKVNADPIPSCTATTLPPIFLITHVGCHTGKLLTYGVTRAVIEVGRRVLNEWNTILATEAPNHGSGE